jgi:hypothetical protein
MLIGAPSPESFLIHFLEKSPRSRMTRMNANRKESLLDFAKLWECDTSSCRFGSNQAWKAVRGRPELQKSRDCGTKPYHNRVNWRDSRAKKSSPNATILAHSSTENLKIKTFYSCELCDLCGELFRLIFTWRRCPWSRPGRRRVAPGRGDPHPSCLVRRARSTTRTSESAGSRSASPPTPPGARAQ